MGIYIRAVKTGETENTVTYRYGSTYEANEDTLILPKLPPEEYRTLSREQLPLNLCSGRIFIQIMKYYSANGTFPDAISFQS